MAATIAIAVAQDGLSASLDLPAGVALTPTELRDLVLGAHLRHGLDRAALQAATMAADHHRHLIVAHGDPPVPGRDGWVEHLVTPPEPPPPAADGSIDFRARQHLPEVQIGTPLVRLHPPEPGRDGVGVDGRILPAPAPAVATLSACTGPGTRVCGDDPTLLEASIAGVYIRLDGKVSAMNPLVIDGDLTLHIGNIDTTVPVMIRGDIKNGLSLKSAGTVEVLGSIEDARVSSAGDLIVKGGILPGRERVKAHGLVSARHISKRMVKAHSVVVDGSIRHSEILASDTITAKEIIGGRLVFGGQMRCDRLGDPTEQHTVLELGADPQVRGHYVATRAMRDAAEAELSRLSERLALMHHHLLRLLANNDVDHVESVGTAVREVETEQARVQAVLEHAERLLVRCTARLAEAERHGVHAEVRIDRMVFPGVEVTHGEEIRLLVQEQMGPARFRVVDGAIAV